MIIANVSRSRRSCRSSLTTIEPSLRRLTRLSPRLFRLAVAATNTSSRFGVGGLDGARHTGARQSLGHAALRDRASFVGQHAQRRADLRERDHARQILQAPLARGAARRCRRAACAPAGRPSARAACRLRRCGRDRESRAVCSARLRPCSASRRAASCLGPRARTASPRTRAATAGRRRSSARRETADRACAAPCQRARAAASGRRSTCLRAACVARRAKSARCSSSMRVARLARGMSCTAARNDRFSTTVRSSYSENFCVM